LRVVVAVDSFKGSVDARAACAAIARGILRASPAVIVAERPMADGGEGTLDALLAATVGGTCIEVVVTGAAGAPRRARAGRLADGSGFVEVAEIVGLTDRDGTAVDVSRRDTRGVGEAILALVAQGVRDITVGLGGSSTNDGGAGLVAALGARLLAAHGDPVAPSPLGLRALARIDARAALERLSGVTLTIMSDVDNPLCGARGATAIFGAQKGVAAEAIAPLDATLARYGALAEKAFGARAAERPGAGAAGGLGFALMLLGARFASGAEVVADRNGLDVALADADWAITGEGRSDAQTLMNKAPYVVATRARRHGVPVTLLSGAVDAAALAPLGTVFDGAFALPPGPATLDASIACAADWLADRAEALARLFLAARG
jgi:glycerate kinase